MKRLVKAASLLGGALLLFFGILLFAFYRLIQLGEFRRFIIDEVENRTQLKVSVGDVELQMGSVVGVSLRDFILLQPKGLRPLLSAEKVFIRVALLPLLERRMVFYEVRLSRPALQLSQEEDGRIPALDLLFSLPLQTQQQIDFILDVRELKLEKGDIVISDPTGNGAAATRFREIDLSLRRLGANGPPRADSQALNNASSRAPSESGLEFDLRTMVERSGQSGGLKSQGKILFPGDRYELNRAWLDADIEVKSLPATLLWGYYRDLFPVPSVKGVLSSRLHWQGSLAERVQVKGEIDFKKLEIDARNYLVSVLKPGNGRVGLEFEWTPQGLRFSRLDLRAEEIALAARGSIRFLAERDPYLEVSFTTPFLPLVAAAKYLPLRGLNSPKLEHLVRTANQGEIRFTQAAYSGRVSEIYRVSEPGFEDRLRLEIEVRGLAASLGEGYLPVSTVGGRLVLEKGSLFYKGFKGSYGGSRLTEVEGSHRGVLRGPGLLELKVKGEVDLGELRGQVALGPLFSVTAGNAVLREVSGKGKLALLLRDDFSSARHFEGQISLDNARLQVGDLALTQVKGGISFSPKEIRAEGITAVLAGSPVGVRVTLNDYGSGKPTFDLAVDSSGVKGGEVLRVLLGVGSSGDSGLVRGTIRYSGSLASTGARELSGSLELVGVRVPLKFFPRPLSEVHGKVKFDGKGIDFNDIKGQVAAYRFGLSGRWRYQETPHWTFSLASPEMDIAYLLPQQETKTDDWFDSFQARGTIAIEKGRYEAFEFTNLSTQLVLDKKVWRLENFSAQSQGGKVEGTGSFAEGPEGLRFSVEPRVKGVPTRGFLSWFDIPTTEISGRVNLTGKLESSGRTGSERKRNLDGAFHLELGDGTVQRFRLLVRILSFLDLSRWFSLKMPDINQEGLKFHSITGDFKVSRGVYSTQNLFVDGEELRITGAGDMDGSKGELDFVIAVRPFPGIDSAVSYIPLIGQGLAAVRNSLMVASFRVKGPVDDPTITPAPLSTLSEFFFSALAIPKGLIRLPGEEQK